MSAPSQGIQRDITAYLSAARAGDAEALDRVVSILYDELHAVAERQLRRERPGHTLTPTALVHEAYLRMTAGLAPDASDRAHFLALSARGMRQVLVDHARRAAAAKRGGGQRPLTLVDAPHLTADPVEILALDAALEALDARQRQVVECRFFAGMELEEIAEGLGVTERTVRRDWVKARAWLYDALYGDPPAAAPTPPA